MAAVTAASEECGPLQIIRVKSQWAEAYGDGMQRAAFSQALWRAIFAYAPETRDMFARVNGDDVTSSEFSAHALRVTSGFDMTVSLMDDPEAFQAQLAHLKGQHEDRQIPGTYFTVFGKALMQVVPATVGKCFDQDAWEACFDVIARGVRE